MEYLLLIGAFEAFSFAILLSFFKKTSQISDKILASFFLILSLSMFLAFMERYNQQHGFTYPFLLFTTSPLILLHGPMLWFYIKSLTKQHFHCKKKYLLHFVPFAIMLIQHSIELFFKPVSEKISIATNADFIHYASFPVFFTLVLVSPLAYFIWGLHIIKKHNVQLKHYFSRINDINLNWLRMLLSASIIFYTLVNSIFLISFFAPIEHPFNDIQMACFSFSTLYVLFLGLYGHKQVNLFSTNAIQIELEAVQPRLATEKLKDADKAFIEKLLQKMATEKPFLDCDLTLSTLSDALSTSPEYLSNILNNCLTLNFYDFINQYRVEEFKTESKSPKNKDFTIIAIAYNCGFNSKATFYRVFKSVTGLTPSEFIFKSQIN